MVAASADDNTRRAIERGSLTVVEKTLEETKELVKSKKIVEESQAQPRCRRRRCCCCCVCVA
ncbi:unnamed protein product [Ectocarpus sp. CCAP 1310/34]|nr:unnamed protein product [Ectocarpus sp. CCAP 1310/34]